MPEEQAQLTGENVEAADYLIETLAAGDLQSVTRLIISTSVAAVETDDLASLKHCLDYAFSLADATNTLKNSAPTLTMIDDTYPTNIDSSVSYRTNASQPDNAYVFEGELSPPILRETPSEREFKEQREAFLKIKPLFLAQHQGEYVASHNGEILDHDINLEKLTARFFSQHGDLPVYITKVGEEVGTVISTPFFP